MHNLREVEETEWYQHWLDLPILRPSGQAGRPLTEGEAFAMPGCCVKSKETEGVGWPKWHGRLKQHSQDKCVVIAHAPPTTNANFVWEGTLVEYERDWRCD